MDITQYIGLDIHKKSISICVKNAAGEILEQKRIPATWMSLKEWALRRTQPWVGALEATMFTGWVYDALKPHAAGLRVVHPAMAKAVTAGKHQSDGLDAAQLADMIRVGWLRDSYMPPAWIRDLRRVLRYRNLLAPTATRLKNRAASILMECGIEYVKDHCCPN
jgi:transposase